MPAFFTGLLLWLLPAAGAVGGVPAQDAYPTLVWYAEMPDGRAPVARQPDEPINPASLVKLATSLWALETLGPEHRFTTRFVLAGEDLVVRGGADPDFHPENAMLVARALNRGGITRVQGRLLVDESFWIGWEHGSARPAATAQERVLEMARRLRQALNPALWTPELRSTWEKLAARENLDARRPPRVVVASVSHAPVQLPAGTAAGEGVVLVHRSAPLAGTLKRFNVWSNNDIERLEAVLGPPPELKAFLVERWGESTAGSITMATTSGLGPNRLTARLAVRLLRELTDTLDRHGLRPADILPVAGCDPGTLKSFPALGDDRRRGAVVGKTGSLTHTDGGVALLAGIAGTMQGDLFFCLVAPRSGAHLKVARSRQEAWVLEMMAALGGARPRPCGLPVRQAGEGVELTGPAVAPASAGEPGAVSRPEQESATP
jgi:D-alanyl-D-alanine carboxypeptidase/D-alanyl-D-alanine-endopeptidase (penicillin-binding protein 4)